MSELFDEYYQAMWDCNIVNGNFICDFCSIPITTGMDVNSDKYAWCYECTVKFAKRYGLESRIKGEW